MRAARIVAALAVAVATGWAPVPGVAAQERLVVTGAVVDADGTPVPGARVTFDGNYSLSLPGGSVVSVVPSGPPGYPGPIGPADRPDVVTGPDGRFETPLPSRVADRLFAHDDEGGFSAQVEFPPGPGELRGPVARVATKVLRRENRVELPEVRAWRPAVRLERIDAALARLRWSELPEAYGLNLQGTGAAFVAARSATRGATVVPTGRFSARLDLRGVPDGGGWAVAARTQVGRRSNVTYGSPVLPVPEGPAPISLRRPCVVVGTGGSVVRGAPCRATDGDPATSPGVVFRRTCDPSDVFCDDEVPRVTAVDLGAPTPIVMVRADGTCVFTCKLLLSDDGVRWRDAPHPQSGSDCRHGAVQAGDAGTADYAAPAGTRARYVGLAGDQADLVEATRDAGALPATSPPFDPDDVSIRLSGAVDAGEIAVFGGPDPFDVCDEEDLPALDAPPVAVRASGERREGRTAPVAVAAVLAAAAGAGVLVSWRLSGRSGLGARPGPAGSQAD